MQFIHGHISVLWIVESGCKRGEDLYEFISSGVAGMLGESVWVEIIVDLVGSIT